jgi:hypothetical protein
MLARESLGHLELTDDRVVIIYRTGQSPTRAANALHHVEDSDKCIIDDDKAFYAEQQGRVLWGLDDDINAQIDEDVEQSLSDHLAHNA